MVQVSRSKVHGPQVLLPLAASAFPLREWQMDTTTTNLLVQSPAYHKGEGSMRDVHDWDSDGQAAHASKCVCLCITMQVQLRMRVVRACP